MNRYQNALERISKIDLNMVLDELGYERSQMISDYGMNDYPNIEMYGDICTLQELVEKATPKKVIKLKEKEYGYTHECPICHSYVGTIVDDDVEYNDYCCSCGQRLDWEE